MSMSEEEENNASQPPKKILGILPATPDAHLWKRKMSTWLAAASLSLKAATLVFVAGPSEWRAGFPVWAGVALLVSAMVIEALIPLATSVQQKAPK